MSSRESPSCKNYTAQFDFKRGVTPLIVYIFVVVAIGMIYLMFPTLGELSWLFTTGWGWMLIIGFGLLIAVVGIGIGGRVRGRIQATGCE